MNVLDAAVAAECARWIAASSASVYGQAERFPDPRRSPSVKRQPRRCSGAAQTFNEGAVAQVSRHFRPHYVALRYFTCMARAWTSTASTRRVLVRWMERLAAGQRPECSATASGVLDFVYMTTLRRATCSPPRGRLTDEVFNVASWQETTLTNLRAAAHEVMGSDPIRNIRACS